MAAMKQQYGADKGKSVFYASRNKGTISGVDKGKKKHKKSLRSMAMKMRSHAAT